MVNKCIIPNCKSGYSSNKSGEKINFFKVPEDQLEVYQKAVRREDFEVKSTHRVCHKHFFPDEIIWRNEVKGPDGTVIASENYERPRLKKGAVPTQFPNCPSYLSKKFNKRKSPKKREFVNHKKRKICNSLTTSKNMTSADSKNQNDFLEEDSNHTDRPEDNLDLPNEENLTTDDSNSKENSEAEKTEMFENLFSNKDAFKIPISWTRSECNDETLKAIIFFQWTVRKEKDIFNTICSKKIILYADMSVKAFVMDVPIDVTRIKLQNDSLFSCEELEKAIEIFNRLKICEGCAPPNCSENIVKTSVYRDTFGYLRHEKCSLLLNMEDIASKKCCLPCKKRKKALMQKTVRLQKEKELKRIVLKGYKIEKQKICLLQSKIKNISRRMEYNERRKNLLKNNLTDLKNKMSAVNSITIEEELNKKNMCENEKLVITEILNAAKCKNNKGRRYSQDWIILCLIFHMKSPAAYRLLRETKVLPLPCTSTIKRYLAFMDTPCGFHEPMFDLLAEKLKSVPEIKRHFIISIDEIYTRKNVTLDLKTKQLNGLSDFGDGTAKDISEKANIGLVIMLQPLLDNYNQPIAVFTSSGPVTGIVLAKLVLQAIILLEKANAKVHGVVSDGAKTNRKFWLELGVQGKLGKRQHSFPHPTVENRKVYCFSDPPHLIKCIRNRLFDSKELKVHPDEEPIKWSYFVKLLEIDKRNLNGRLCPKLTNEHVNPNNLLKMRVSLAQQIFSMTTAKGLLFYKNYKDFKEDLKGCENTAEFCIKIHNLFDAMNRMHPETALKYNSVDTDTLKNFLSWLDDWEQRLKKHTKSEDGLTVHDLLTYCVNEGLRVTLQSMIDLKKTLLEEYKFQYVLTGKINQDPLERFFGTIRYAGGSNDHPSTPTFLQLYKILTTFSILKPPKSGNCTTFDAQPSKPLITIDKLKELFNSKKKSAFQEIKEKIEIAVEIEDSNFNDFVNAVDHDYNMPEVINCVLFYTTAAIRIRQYLREDEAELKKNSVLKRKAAKLCDT